MTIREILKYPDSRLRWESIRARKPNSCTEALVNDMLDTMYANNGLGLAAIQIGVPTRIIVLNINQRGYGFVLVNPKIIGRAGVVSSTEGCLSIPGAGVVVERSANIQVKFRDMAWKYHTEKMHGLLAKCIQHEIDHLDGKLIIDYEWLSNDKDQALPVSPAPASR